MEKKLKIVLCTLIIILIVIIAFMGVYSKNLNIYKSEIPEYLLASELKGKRMTYFKVNEGTEEKIYDKEGKEVDSIPEGENEADYRKEQVKINSEEALTEENYQKAKEIFDGRLNELGVEDYSVRLNKANGEMVVELDDDKLTDTLLRYLLCKGDFVMKDSADDTVLMERSDIKNASVTYGNTGTGSVTVYLSIKFNKEGAKKLSEVSKNYLKVETTDENGETKDDNSKKVTMIIEGTEFLTASFDEENTTGELTISVGSGTDNATVYEYATQAQVYAMLLNNEEMPITLEAVTTEYIPTDINETIIYIVTGIIAGVAVILMLYMIIRYKTDGLLSSISFVSAVALLLLMIRYTGTRVSLGSMAAMLVLIVFDGYFMIKILKDIKNNPSEDNVRFMTYGAYMQKLELIIVFLIIAVIFTFMPEVQVFSIGMTLFYGIISLIISNLLFMRTMLIAKHK